MASCAEAVEKPRLRPLTIPVQRHLERFRDAGSDDSDSESNEEGDGTVLDQHQYPEDYLPTTVNEYTVKKEKGFERKADIIISRLLRNLMGKLPVIISSYSVL